MSCLAAEQLCVTECKGFCSYDREGYGGGYGREPAGYGRCVYIIVTPLQSQAITSLPLQLNLSS